MHAPNPTTHAPTIDDIRALAGADTPVRPASAVKAGWSGIVRDAARHGEVIVTNHNRAEVVVLDIAAYAALVHRAQANDPLRVLQADFDRRMAAFATSAGNVKLRTAAAAGIAPPPAVRKTRRAAR